MYCICSIKMTFLGTVLEVKIKRAVVKVIISSDVNLSLPTVSDSLLKQVRETNTQRKRKRLSHYEGECFYGLKRLHICIQFQSRLEEQGMSDVKIHWQADKNAQVFHREQDNKGAKKTGAISSPDILRELMQ